MSLVCDACDCKISGSFYRVEWRQTQGGKLQIVHCYHLGCDSFFKNSKHEIRAAVKLLKVMQ